MLSRFWRTPETKEPPPINRRALVARLAELADGRDDISARHESRRVPLMKAEADLKAKYEAAHDKRLEVDKAYARDIGALDAESARLRRELVASAPPEIAEAIATMRHRYDAARGAVRVFQERPTGRRSGSTGALEMMTISNDRAIRRLLDAMNLAQRSLEQLAFEAVAGDELEARIDAILSRVEQAWESIRDLDPDPVAA